MKKLLLILITFCLGANLRASNIDDPYKFETKQLILPLSLGILASTTLFIPQANQFDKYLQKNIQSSKHYGFDDYLQFAPLATLWILDACKVNSRHNFKHQTTNLALALGFTTALSYSLKYTIKRAGPAGDDATSFPSGHSAIAFMGAEFLRMEFSETNIWIGIAGYGFALTTAAMRVLNNEHYPLDVIAGAGVGILSVKLAYWLAPWVNRVLWGEDIRSKSRITKKVFSPYYCSGTYGVSMSGNF